MRSDGYAEYYDEAFLERLRVKAVRTPLNKLWPSSGPRWDGLARTDTGKVLLVEAKAHIGEMISHTRASSGSLRKIRAALRRTKTSFGAADDFNSESPFYQYANRLAHLYFLRELNRLDAYLLFVYFSEAPDVPTGARCTANQWEGAIRLADKALGLGSHPYTAYIKSLIMPVLDNLPR
jgi:hypothetical protein